MNLWPPPSWEMTDGAFGRMVAAEECWESRSVADGEFGAEPLSLPFLAGAALADPFTLFPAVPADILGARLGARLLARVEGALPHSLSETDGEGVLGAESAEMCLSCIGGGVGGGMLLEAKLALLSDSIVSPGLLGYARASGGGIGTCCDREDDLERPCGGLSESWPSELSVGAASSCVIISGGREDLIGEIVMVEGRASMKT